MMSQTRVFSKTLRISLVIEKYHSNLDRLRDEVKSEESQEIKVLLTKNLFINLILRSVFENSYLYLYNLNGLVVANVF